LQSRYDTPTDEVLFNDLVDVLFINIGIPDVVRINDQNRSVVAAVQAARLVDADLALALEAKLADALLGISLDFSRPWSLQQVLPCSRWLQQKKTWC
jgi:hypothetical protein